MKIREIKSRLNLLLASVLNFILVDLVWAKSEVGAGTPKELDTYAASMVNIALGPLAKLIGLFCVCKFVMSALHSEWKSAVGALIAGMTLLFLETLVGMFGG